MDLQDILQGAGDAAQVLVQSAQPVDSLIAMVQQGGKVNPLVMDLYAADPDNAKAVEAMQVSIAVADIDLPSDAKPVHGMVEAMAEAANPVDLVGTRKK